MLQLFKKFDDNFISVKWLGNKDDDYDMREILKPLNVLNCVNGCKYISQ